MRRNVGKALLVWAFIVAYPLSAETPRAGTELPAVSTRIADALCGRTNDDPRAAALNESDLALVLKRWGGSRGDEVRIWLAAPPCRQHCRPFPNGAERVSATSG